MNVPVNHPDLITDELPAGLSASAIVKRKKALIANGMGYEVAEVTAINAEHGTAAANGEAGIVASDDVSSTILPPPAPEIAPSPAPEVNPPSAPETTPPPVEPAESGTVSEPTA